MTNSRSDVVISANGVPEIAEGLNAVLADSFALYLKTKNFHWHVTGPHFRDYHLLFEEQAGELIGITDDLAERVRKLGQRTLTSIGDISRRQSLEDNDDEGVSPQLMLRALIANNQALATKMRTVHEVAAGYNDFATASILEDFIDQAEKRVWFLEQTATPA